MASWTLIRDALLLLALAPFAYYALALIACSRFFEARAPEPLDFTPPVSILKPVRGLDREAYENYASFCRQDYPDFEILFGVSDSDDAAIPVIKRIIADFPERAIRLVIGSEPLGVSDKVNNLCRLVREARHKILIVSDSDVRTRHGLLRALVAPLCDTGVGGVTCLYRGVTDGSLPADLEALGNSTDFVPGVLVAWMFGGLDFMLGAVMATTKAHLAQIGGFEALVDHFSDDYELGNRIAARGHRVELSAFPVAVVYPQLTLEEAFRHQLRWNLSIRYSRPAGHFGLIFTQGLAWTLLALFIAPSALIAASYLAGYVVLRAGVVFAAGWRGMRDDLAWRKPWLLPLRDAFAFAVWIASFFPQRIHWRGQQFCVRNKRLVPIRPRQS